MSYKPTVWKDGDLITAERLNQMERGIQDAQAGGTESAGPSIPPGGSKGQVLMKESETDGDAQWRDLPESGVTMEQVNVAIQSAILDSWEGSY